MQNNVGIYASQISGHLWAPNGAYDALATVTVGSTSVATVSFAGIPQGYRNLEIRCIAKAPSGGGGGIYIRFNGDSGSNYSAHNINGDGASAGAQSQSSTSTPLIIRNGGISTTTSTFSAAIIHIVDYASNTKNTTLRSLGGQDLNGSGLIEEASIGWYNTASVTSIDLIHNGSGFTQYSQFCLFGVK